MITQIQPTPTLYGEDARVVLNEIKRKPTKDQKEKLLDKYRKMFEGIMIKGS